MVFLASGLVPMNGLDSSSLPFSWSSPIRLFHSNAPWNVHSGSFSFLLKLRTPKDSRPLICRKIHDHQSPSLIPQCHAYATEPTHGCHMSYYHSWIQLPRVHCSYIHVTSTCPPLISCFHVRVLASCHVSHLWLATCPHLNHWSIMFQIDLISWSVFLLWELLHLLDFDDLAPTTNRKSPCVVFLTPNHGSSELILTICQGLLPSI